MGLLRVENKRINNETENNYRNKINYIRQSPPMASAEQPSISASDRMSFTVFLAGIVHAMLIFGVSFAWEQYQRPHTLEVTLAQHSSSKAPDKADFLAETNQQGSGTLKDKAIITTTEVADFHSDQVQEVQLQEKTALKKSQAQQQQPVITTTSNTNKRVNNQALKNDSTEDAKISKSASLLERSKEIASLEAQLSKKKQAYAKRPRIRRLTSVSTKAHQDARYIEEFRKAVEEVATQHFPKEALAKNLLGTVRLMVAINSDGSIREIKILKRSRYPIINDAAVQSVKLSAPFPPFPKAIRKNTDVLEIIRTWHFDAKYNVSVSE